jgi:Disulphide bond corrector protein DsbC
MCEFGIDFLSRPFAPEPSVHWLSSGSGAGDVSTREKHPMARNRFTILVQKMPCFGLALVSAAAMGRAQSAPVVTARLVLDSDAVHPGSVGKAAVIAEVAPGYHINDHVPSLDYLIPTELKLESPPVLETGRAVYPKGTPRKFQFLDQAISVYEGRLVISESFKVASEAKPGEYPLKGALEYQACNDHACLPPTKLTLSLNVKVVPRGESIRPINADVFAKLKLN